MAKRIDWEQAEELISRLELPAEAGRLITDSRYWHELVFLAVCERCDHLIFTEPQKGFALAEHLPRFADRIPVERCVVRSPGHLKGLGFTLYASGLRAAGRHEESEVAYVAAALLLKGAPLDDRAMFWRRFTHLRINQRRLEEALATAESAVQVSRRIDSHELGKALMWRGLVHWFSDRPEKALQDYSGCLTHLDPERDEASARYYFCTIGNVGAALERAAVDATQVREALRHLSRAKGLSYFESGTLPLVKITWAESRCFEKLGEMDRAEQGYREARAGLEALNLPFEYALASLDLTARVFARGGYAEVARIAAELWPIFKSLKLARDDEAYAAVMLFYRSAQALTLTQAVLEDARAKLRSHDLAQG